MKIDNELERLLLLQQQGLDIRQGSVSIDSAQFTQILEGQMANQAIAEDSKGQILQGLADPTNLLNIGLSNLAGLDSEANQDYEAALQSMLASCDNLLGGIDNYAATLSAPGGIDLRTTWNMLDALDGQTGELRSALQNLDGNRAGMDSLVAEVEILLATEKFKLNRGDYF